MNELFIHLNKDLRQVRMESSFLILVALMLISSVFLAYIAVLDYLSIGYEYVITNQMKMDSLSESMSSYWTNVIYFQGLLLFIFSASAFGNEKESGILRFTLAYGADRKKYFLGKLLLMCLISLISLASAMLMFVVMISASGTLPLDMGAFFGSAMFVLLQFIIIISFGMLISSLTKKKAAAIVLAIAFMIGSSGTTSYFMGEGESAAWNDYHQNEDASVEGDYDNEYIASHFPVVYMILICLLPWEAATEGIKQSVGIDPDISYSTGAILFSPEIDLLLCLGLIAIYLGVGYLIFSGERKEFSMRFPSFGREQRPDEGTKET